QAKTLWWSIYLEIRRPLESGTEALLPLIQRVTLHLLIELLVVGEDTRRIGRRLWIQERNGPDRYCERFVLLTGILVLALVSVLHRPSLLRLQQPQRHKLKRRS